MAKRATFDEQSATRIGKVVRRVEAMPTVRVGGRSDSGVGSNHIYKGKLDGDLTAGENSQTVSIWAGTPPGDTGDNVTAWGWLLGADLSSGDEVGIAWLNGRWEVLGSLIGSGGETHTEITVVTNVQVDTATNTIQIKTRTCEVVNPGTESGWTTIHTGTECA